MTKSNLLLMQHGVDFIHSNSYLIILFRKAKKSQPKSDVKYSPEEEKWENKEFWNDKSEFQDKLYENLNRFTFSRNSTSPHSLHSHEKVKGENVIVMVDLELKELIKGKKVVVKYD